MIQDLPIGVGIPILQMISCECAQLFMVGEFFVYTDVTQNTLYAGMVTTFLRISALSPVRR